MIIRQLAIQQPLKTDREIDGQTHFPSDVEQREAQLNAHIGLDPNFKFISRKISAQAITKCRGDQFIDSTLFCCVTQARISLNNIDRQDQGIKLIAAEPRNNIEQQLNVQRGTK